MTTDAAGTWPGRRPGERRDGRSAETFVVDVVVRAGGAERRVVARGQDIYAVSAPLAVEAVDRILDRPDPGDGVARRARCSTRPTSCAHCRRTSRSKVRPDVCHRCAETRSWAASPKARTRAVAASARQSRPHSSGGRPTPPRFHGLRTADLGQCGRVAWRSRNRATSAGSSSGSG